MSMQIFVLSPKNKTIVLDVEPADTIAVLKQKLVEKEGFEKCEIFLIFQGKCLADDRTLADYNVQDDSTLNMSVKFLGGCSK